MDIERLREILSDCTIQLRKGEEVHGDPHLVAAINEGRPLEELPGGVVTIDDMPPVEAAKPGLELIDMVFLVIGVDKVRAENHRDELINILKSYPQPERLAGGPSYIEVGAVVGDQGLAFQLFALGQVLDLWRVITPKVLGIKGEDATLMAGTGFIMISGYKVAA